jgi:hypothetical protein
MEHLDDQLLLFTAAHRKVVAQIEPRRIDDRDI